jgi:alpha-N-arabinofuranosidase
MAIHNEEAGELTIFAVNRDQQEALPVTIDIRSFGNTARRLEHIVLEHTNLKARNTASEPNLVQPHTRGQSVLQDGHITASLTKASWNVIRIQL